MLGRSTFVFFHLLVSQLVTRLVGIEIEWFAISLLSLGRLETPCATRGLIGPIISTLGALLILGGNFLPSNGDYQFQMLHYSPFDPKAVVFLIIPGLIVLAISAYCWFWKGGCAFLALGLSFIALALLWHCFLQAIGGMGGIMRCFDACPPETFYIGAGFWLPLIGYAVSGLGLLITFATHRLGTTAEVSVSK